MYKLLIDIIKVSKFYLSFQIVAVIMLWWIMDGVVDGQFVYQILFVFCRLYSSTDSISNLNTH